MTNMAEADFWRWFVANEQSLRRCSGEVVADRVEKRLQEVDSRLGVEVSHEANEHELIVTAGGDPEAFPTARELVSKAPKLRHWAISALKPPRGFKFQMSLDGTTVEADQLLFEPLQSASHPQSLGIRLVLPGALQASAAQLHEVAHLIIETGIGEELAAYVDHVDVATTSVELSTGLPISDLAKYITWHLKDRASK